MAARAAAAQSNAKTAAARFQAARKAYQAGDVFIAALLFQRTALAKRASPDMRNEAQRVLAEFREMAQNDVAEIVEQIRYAGQQSSGDAQAAAEQIRSALEEMDDLVVKYKNVPVANDKLERAQEKLLHKDQTVGKYLHQPVAAQLVKDAQQYEADNYVCCAYLCYREAAKLMTCDAAKEARKRLYHLKKQPGVLQAVARCETVRECQVLFDKAQRIAKQKKHRKHAAKLYKQIVEEAPRESEVHKAAMAELNRITARG
jgi:hypothetical protein